jgi:hypothetical protein
MKMLNFDHEGKRYSAKITHATRNDRNYYWVDIVDKALAAKVGQSFTFINSSGYNLSLLTQVNKENKKLTSFFRRKIVQIFMHNQLQLNEGGYHQST